METEVLRPQNCLPERIRLHQAVFSVRENYYGGSSIINSANATSSSNGNGRVNRKQQVVRDRDQNSNKRFISGERTSDQPILKRSSSNDLKTAKIGPVMEKVMIVRRGESLDSKIKIEPVKSVNLMSPVAVKRDVCAGSAFQFSPEPSSLPLPSFSKKKSFAETEDSATRDLRRLLRLD